MALVMEQEKAADPPDVGLLGPIAVMTGADRLAHLIEQRESDRRRERALRLMGRLPMGGGVCRPKRRINLDRLSGEECQHMVERFVGVGKRPAFLTLMPAATKNGFDFRHALSGVREEHNESSCLTWFDLNLVCRRLHRSSSLA